MRTQLSQVKSFFSFRRILIPILIGLGVSFYLVYQNLNEDAFIETINGQGNYNWTDSNHDNWESNDEFVKAKNGNFEKTNIIQLFQKINWTFGSLICIFCAILTMLIRDFAYMLRIRILSDNQLSWKSAFHSIMLWETASAITPSVVGGSSIAMFILNKEGINLGKSTAIVMASAFLDELFFILFVPLIFVIVGGSTLFPNYISFTFFGNSIDVFSLFIFGYSVLVFFVLFVAWGLFLKPIQLKKILFFIFSFSFLKKWQKKAIVTGNEIVIASAEFKLKSYSYWLKSFGATSLSWISRYFTANLIIMAFVAVDDHFLIIARQLVMWVILLISPTPGGSGFAELLFTSFLKDSSISHLAILAAIVWRFISYYPYLFIGAIIFPTWLKKVNRKETKV